MSKSTSGKDPRYTVIIVGEDGELYKLTKDVWEQHKMSADLVGAAGVIKGLTDFGSYLSFIPDTAVGYGTACTVVNLKAILQNNPPQAPQPPGKDRTKE